MVTRITWPRNRLLAALPAHQLKHLAREFEHVECHRGEMLLDVDGALDEIFFFDSAVAVVLAVYPDGEAVTVAAMGHDGSSAAEAVLEGQTSSVRFLVYIPGTAAKLPRAAFRHAMHTMPAFRRVMYAHVRAYLEQMTIAVACRSAHSLKRRLARWLLTLRDANENDALPLSHTELASLLGVQRPSLTKALLELEHEGCVAGGLRKLTLVNRRVLAKFSCECYHLLRKRTASPRW